MEIKLIFFVGAITTVYFLINKYIFDKVFLTSQQIIDEEFHIPQGKLYCNFNFSTWDPKITTLPGLYLASTALIRLFNFECTSYNLRFFNLTAATINYLLIFRLFNFYGNKTLTWQKQILSSINLSILPPMFFFSHLYYTDILSITTILLILIGTAHGHHIITSFTCFASIIVRQTNVIYTIFCAQQLFVDNFIQYGKPVRRNYKQATFKQKLQYFSYSIVLFFNRKYPIYKIPLQIYMHLLGYASVLVAFGVFVYCNGGIVVGDKTAHTVSIHIPQLFYFSAFVVFFLMPFSIRCIYPFLIFVKKHSFLSLIGISIIITIVHFNTIAHPYLLADNRHYTFYIWMRCYNRFFMFKYAMCIIYFFGLYIITSICTELKSIGFFTSYMVSCVSVLIFQSMIELRYFLIPFIILRLQIVTNVHWKSLILEFIFYFLINYQAFKIFFEKNIIWENYSDPQKLIW